MSAKAPAADVRRRWAANAGGLLVVTHDRTLLRTVTDGDLRRLIVPINYFIEQPFQNWTRRSSEWLPTHEDHAFVQSLMGRVVANDAASYKYLAESIRMFPDQETLATLMRAFVLLLEGFGRIVRQGGRKPGA